MSTDVVVLGIACKSVGGDSGAGNRKYAHLNTFPSYRPLQFIIYHDPSLVYKTIVFLFLNLYWFALQEYSLISLISP